MLTKKTPFQMEVGEIFVWRHNFYRVYQRGKVQHPYTGELKNGVIAYLCDKDGNTTDPVRGYFFKSGDTETYRWDGEVENPDVRGLNCLDFTVIKVHR